MYANSDMIAMLDTIAVYRGLSWHDIAQRFMLVDFAIRREAVREEYELAIQAMAE